MIDVFPNFSWLTQKTPLFLRTAGFLNSSLQGKTISLWPGSDEQFLRSMLCNQTL